MIIRHLAVRHGSRAIARNASQPIRRFFASDVDAIAASAENSFKQLHSIEAQINAQPTQSSHPIPSYDPAHSTGAQPEGMSMVEQYQIYKHQKQVSSHVGTEITPHYEPHTLLSHPPSAADVTLELLLASEAHQGHATSLWNPANARYIYGIRQGIHIISLEATAAHLRRAAKVVQEVSRRGGLILFVGTRDGQDTAVVRAAQLSKAYHLFERWIPGSITNGQQILGRCRTKVVNERDEEVKGFEEQLFDRPVLRPDLVVCMNPLENYVLLHECALNNIPTIGVIDTNADPTWVTYPIPANDDSVRCIQVIAGVLGRAGEVGTKQRLAAAENGEITYRPAAGLVLPEEEEQTSKKPVQDADLSELGEVGIDNADEIVTKLENARNNDGRRMGHRIRISA